MKHKFIVENCKVIPSDADIVETQRARIAELEAQLSAVGAGGVEPLRKRERMDEVLDEDDLQDLANTHGFTGDYEEMARVVEQMVLDKLQSGQPSRECLQQSAEEVDFLLEDLPPVEGLDVILAEYEKTYGRTPDAAMASSVAKVKNMLLMWWGSHREAIAAALQAAPPAQEHATQLAGGGQDFDTWQSNPYTKVLLKSIAEDYVPKVVQAQEDARDTERLDWLTFNLSGAALRAIGVVWSEHADARRAIDAARAAQGGRDE